MAPARPRAFGTHVPAQPSSAEQLLAHIPQDQRRFADGRATHTTLAGMIDEWRRIQGGSATLRGGKRWTFYSDDSWTAWGRRGAAQSAVLCAISDHASARALVSGYSGGIPGNAGRMSYFSATAIKHDGVPLALAALDLELTGSTSVSDWYLATWCPSLGWHQHHGNDDIPCGAATCGTADPGSTCDCICKGVNHGMGEGSGKVGPAPPPDWASSPAPTWAPGSGTVEVPVEDEFTSLVERRRVADRATPHDRYLIRGQWRPEEVTA